MSTRLLLYDGIHIPQCENSYGILSGRQKFVERFHSSHQNVRLW